MARPLRTNIADGWFHVTSRGANRNLLFRNDLDRTAFLRSLGVVHTRFGIDVHAYCLMGNHYHLLLRTRAPNLSAAMHHLNSGFARRFNSTHGRTGPVFERRFFSSLITTESYVVAAARYIHHNPVEAGLVERPVQWRWSSAAAVGGLSRRPRWLCIDPAIHPRVGRARRYERDAWTDIPVIGERPEPVLTEFPPDPETAASWSRSAPVPTLTEIEQAIVARTSASLSSIVRPSPGRSNMPRALACYLAREIGRCSLSEIAERYGYASYKGVSSAHQRLRARVAYDTDLRSILDDLVGHLARIKPAA